MIDLIACYALYALAVSGMLAFTVHVLLLP